VLVWLRLAIKYHHVAPSRFSPASLQPTTPRFSSRQVKFWILLVDLADIISEKGVHAVGYPSPSEVVYVKVNNIGDSDVDALLCFDVSTYGARRKIRKDSHMVGPTSNRPVELHSVVARDVPTNRRRCCCHMFFYQWPRGIVSRRHCSGCTK
jgi:hypothetical protein